MKLLLLFISSLLAAASVQAQKQDSVVLPRRSGIEFSLDYGKILTLASDFETKWEVGIGYRIKGKLVPHVHIGQANLQPRTAFENGAYTSKGMYGRAGLSYILPLQATTSLYFGINYAISQFEESNEYTIASSIWPDFNASYSRQNLQADWAELIIGSEKRLNEGNWYLGGIFSVRVLNSHDEFEPIDIYSIPGYGRTSDNTVPAITVYIKYLL